MLIKHIQKGPCIFLLKIKQAVQHILLYMYPVWSWILHCSESLRKP